MICHLAKKWSVSIQQLLKDTQGQANYEETHRTNTS